MGLIKKLKVPSPMVLSSYTHESCRAGPGPHKSSLQIQNVLSQFYMICLLSKFFKFSKFSTVFTPNSLNSPPGYSTCGATISLYNRQ